MGDNIIPSNIIPSNSIKSQGDWSKEKVKFSASEDQSIGDEWIHGEDLQNGAAGLDAIKLDEYTQQTLEATARVKAQRAKEARLAAKKDAIWQQKEAQREGLEKKKAQRGKEGSPSSSIKDIPINADAERGFTGKFGLTRCLPANQEVNYYVINSSPFVSMRTLSHIIAFNLVRKFDAMFVSLLCVFG